ncbi:microtubule-associated tumor suppressor candidate 2-like [Spea bombifrons]|uniref:microtubule-associated tumor suppressor candidate 2-like n=1 Tax=Spea bombifrons TaxID=233779 RepID=UPI002349B959|nr:microtubule-associated tumor suppressor candidate 2-like [Spea bombifrons]
MLETSSCIQTVNWLKPISIYGYRSVATDLLRDKQKELAAQLAAIREDVALNRSRCEILQKEKEELEVKLATDVRELKFQQQADLEELKERFNSQCIQEIERVKEEHDILLKEIQFHHQEQIKTLSANHEAVLAEVKLSHSAAIQSMSDDHERLVDELKESHEYEMKQHEDNFEKLRLSLQDQVDTLTFQNRSLKDKITWLEDSLKKSTKEQLQVVLAPYQYLEQDLNSMKAVLDLKNELIRKKEKRIMELEMLVETNFILEKKVQILQQKNEDLSAQIDRNTEVTRQLSAENTHLRENIEKEIREKKQLSMTNEELVWKLQNAKAQPTAFVPY